MTIVSRRVGRRYERDGRPLIKKNTIQDYMGEQKDNKKSLRIRSVVDLSERLHNNAIDLIGSQVSAQANGSYSFESDTQLSYQRDVEIAEAKESFLRQLSVRSLVALAAAYLKADITLSDGTVVQPEIIDKLTSEQLLLYLGLLVADLGIVPATSTVSLSAEALAALLVGFLAVRIEERAEINRSASEYESDTRGRLKHSLKIEWSFSGNVDSDNSRSCSKKRSRGQ